LSLHNKKKVFAYAMCISICTLDDQSLITISSKSGMCQVLLSRSSIDPTLSISGSNVDVSVTTTIQVNHLLLANSIAEWSNQIQHESHNAVYEHMRKRFNFSSSWNAINSVV